MSRSGSAGRGSPRVWPDRRHPPGTGLLSWLAVASLLTCPAAARAGPWALSEFAVYLWGGAGVQEPEARARALAQAGFTVVNWGPDDLDVLPRHGLKAMVPDPAPEVARRLAGQPAVWGYHCSDEPYPEEAFPPLAARLRELERLDPQHLPFVNVLSTTGLFLRTFMQVVQPALLSFDYYQWWWGSDRYFEKLEEFRELAMLAGVPLGSCLEVNANPAVERGDSTHLADNALRLRQSLYTNLAYGVKMVEWYDAALLFRPGSGALTPAGEDVAALNQELRQLGPVLVGLRSLGVFHTPPLPRGTREAPKEHWVQLIGEEGRPGLVQGMFAGAEGLDYMLVANRDCRAAQSVTVRLQSRWLGIAPWQKPKKPTYRVETFDRRTGQWQTVSSSSFVGFTFVIGPADGEVFRLTTQVEKAR
ncbi:MAG: hypothetical protein AB1505_30270 [Candidatus Latescibacterota bacterium]